jgi:hypothetical protein
VAKTQHAQDSIGVGCLSFFFLCADICQRLSLIASDDEVSSRLIVMAQDYKAKGNAVEAESKSPLTAMVIHSVSRDRETNQS